MVAGHGGCRPRDGGAQRARAAGGCSTVVPAVARWPFGRPSLSFAGPAGGGQLPVTALVRGG